MVTSILISCSFLFLFYIGVNFYFAYKLKEKIIKIIFILQNMAIDDYYEHIYKKEFEKDKHITDNYDEFFGDDIDDMLNQVPSILELIISFKPMDIKSYMPNEFYFRYKMFVKDNYEYLYNKYLQKTLVAEIYQEINI